MFKSEIRKKYNQKRKAFTAEEVSRLSENISDLFFKNFSLQEKTISIFLPIEKNNEVNTFFILDQGILKGAIFGVPKMDAEHLRLCHFLYESRSQLGLNSYGIPEPQSGKKLASDIFDIVLIPLLAFDANGMRVGYGKGYYDRFLKNCNPKCNFIGLSLFDEMVEIDDVDRMDVPMDYCITPNRIVHFNNSKYKI